MEFKARIIKISSNSYGITIPKAFVENKALEIGKQYRFTTEEAEGEN